ncbi:transcriptional regulator GcvA [Nitratireductor sp. ZSWI3]|uniref:transcriptional regulator GcvA n=1 Tax=Nitratireductor sp. ZSWI3 TaxID=2966359 RepID=UPI00215056CF|nr:transcriptional regulator GcvA [Nitratireductor sp. ZSWI3]MCR4265156.1 transcriptional regulator GcvA [Nitratireductor sp. ZSWI3]
MHTSYPPLNPLRTFEVAARLCSLTLAAEELNVSQVAVSRQVKVLEEYLGVTLFKRLHRGIELTDEGKQLYDGVARAFQDIGNASRLVSRRGRRDILAIQSYTTFSQRWLIPRLTHFHDAHPRIEVRLSSSIAPVDFETQNLDAAIRAGKGDWPGLHSEKLADIELIPICSPAFHLQHKLEHPNDLSRVRLLHSMARPTDWAAWIKRVGANVDANPGMRFESSALAYEAASLDGGVAIAVKVFVKRQLHNGSLVAPFEQTCYSGEGYFLTWPQNTMPSPPLMKFLGWIRDQMQLEE